MSGPAGENRDSALFVQFYYPETFYWNIAGRLKQTDTPKVQTTFSTPQIKKDSSVPSQFTRWKMNGFHEEAVSIKIDRYENIAHAWVVAQVKPKENETLTYRVQDSFQLYYDGKRWWIMSIAWQPETKWEKIKV